ncbi:uncharacterized protein LOC108629366 isoform X1 [Ceratina calcarata]|uniref:Uncharacterized protein LOC108629366 isoform X1 n=1 Tax=Ceratina calcarata TaxID=156304 RepID=A0AAJ7WE79_9HYME|nr:uncharacterized protein LOC108629366 isoform X1 [Ceratina calcarata]
MKGKDLPPSGYDVTLILPQCVCLKNYQEYKKINESKSDETLSDGKSETISNLICMPSVTELSWDILQSGAFEKIPEKYTTNIFETKKKESEDAGCFKTQRKICEVKGSHVSYCFHKIFFENLNKSYTSM